MESGHTVCKAGDVLTPEQARILVSEMVGGDGLVKGQ